MEQYNSKHTGAQIDAAVTRALPGGDIDSLLNGKAPAGYGLGGGATKTVETDFNNYIGNGVYQCPASFDSIQNAPPNGHYGMLIVSHGSNAIVQDVYGPSWVSSAIRWFHVRRVSTSSDGNADSWSEWEWPEPLMEIGVEYRTTERYQGKPVYAKLVNCGNLPNATEKMISGYAENVHDVVDFGGMSLHFGQSLLNEGFTTLRVTQSLIAISCTTDLSAGSAEVWVKYTKTTD